VSSPSFTAVTPTSAYWVGESLGDGELELARLRTRQAESRVDERRQLRVRRLSRDARDVGHRTADFRADRLEVLALLGARKDAFRARLRRLRPRGRPQVGDDAIVDRRQRQRAAGFTSSTCSTTTWLGSSSTRSLTVRSFFCASAKAALRTGSSAAMPSPCSR
jgi:hypothetical protein